MESVRTASSLIRNSFRREIHRLNQTKGGLGARLESAPVSATSEATELPKSIESMIARRVEALDLKDPEVKNKTLRIFLESILLAEFGDAQINDRRFVTLVDKVQMSILKAEQLNKLVDTCVDELLAGR